MPKPEVLQLRPYSEHDNAELERHFELFRIFEAEDSSSYLAQYGDRIRAIAGRGDLIVDRQMMAEMPNLEIISVFGAGYDGVDVEAASEAGIIVTNTPDVLSGDVADLAVALFMGLTRDIVSAHDYVRSGDWSRRGPYRLFRRIAGQRAGIVGLGRIGLEIGRRLHALGMEISYWSRMAKDCPEGWNWVGDPHQLASESQALFVALAANEDTCQFVDRRMMEALGPDGVLVNISRAMTVDEEALLDSLENGKLGGAGIDVFKGEPNVDPRFHRLENVILHPHHGSGTIESRKEMGELVITNLKAHFQGKSPLTPVNREVVGLRASQRAE